MPQEIQLAPKGSAGLYVAFAPTQARIAAGAKVATCSRCGRLCGHYPRDSFGHDIICARCADDIPAIRAHLDELAKAGRV